MDCFKKHLLIHKRRGETENSRKYKCKNCGKSFIQKGTLQQHNHNVHDDNKDFKCEICGIEFFRICHLSKHKKEVHPYKCDICDKTFTIVNKLKKHYQIVHDRQKDNNCDKSFTTSGILKKLSILEPHKSKECNKCETSFSRLDSLKRHIDIIHNGQKGFRKHQKWRKCGKIEKPLEKPICNICDKAFTNPFSVKNHQRKVHEGNNHKGRKRHKCQICGKEYHFNHKLDEHIRGIHGNESYKCELCNKDFTQACHLKWHKKNSHETRGLQCETCGKTFPTNNSLNFHINHVHKKIKQHQCDDCDTSFAHRGHLLAHVKNIHLKIKDNKCEFCVKSFAKKSYLTLHIKMVHVGTKDVFCDKCDKTFTNNIARNQHINFFHKGNNKCNICNATYESYVGLRYHLNNFHCDICKKAFHKEVNLKLHRKNVHAPEKVIQEKFEKPEIYNSCNKTFIQRLLLKPHIESIKIIHKESKIYNSATTAVNEKIFKCYLCEKNFDKHILKTHEKNCDKTLRQVDENTENLLVNSIVTVIDDQNQKQETDSACNKPLSINKIEISEEKQNHIEKVLLKEQRSENLIQSDANTVSKSIPNISINNDISIDMSKSSDNNKDNQEDSTNSINVWCIRCEMMVNSNHRELCEKFCHQIFRKKTKLANFGVADKII